jgi:hypothetical protein
MIAKEIWELMNTNEQGEKVDLLDLRMLEPINNRIESLETILIDSNDVSLKLDAALLLTGWGIEKGLEYLDMFLDRDAIDEEGSYLCRNSKDNCTYDIISQSLVAFTDGNTEKASMAIAPLRKVLSYFGRRSFDHGINSSLLCSEISIYLIDDLKKAIDFCIEKNKIEEASTMLNVYTKWGGESVTSSVIKYIEVFMAYSNSPYPKINVSVTLPYLPLNIALSLIPALELVDDNTVQFYLNKFIKSLKH